MPTGTLMLVRHGQSIWNSEDRFTGWTDVPLTDQGRDEARAAGELLKTYHFDCAFTSALGRAQETLRIILGVIGQPDLPVEYDAALNERHYGDLQGLNKTETAEKIGREIVHQWRRSYDVPPPGGESLKDTQARVMPYYRARIEPLVVSGQSILVVAHANSLRALVMVLDGVTPEAVPGLKIPTGIPRCYQIDANGTILGRCYL
jgi:2,3-bisphosphoglycerate-dependent phosphoglycerate mutase